MDSLAIGIDLGTTYSSVAVFDPVAGSAQVVPNADGERLTPSAVYLTEAGDLQVGSVAIGQARRTPERVKRWIKRDMGQEIQILLGDACFRPEEVSAAILCKLLRDTEQFFGARISRGVVTVPAYFDEPRRKATADAAAIAGLEEVRLLNEPTATGLTFGMQERPGELFLVYDLGGGTFDVSVMRSGQRELEVLATAGDHYLGGYDFDMVLAHHLARGFAAEHGFAPMPDDPDFYADWYELMEEAEEAKMKLSRLEEVQATVRCRGQRSDFVVARCEFEALIAPYIERTEALVLQALVDAGVEPEQIAALLLAGGSTRIPAFRASLRNLLPHLEPQPGVNPDEVVALGAAVRAHMLQGGRVGRLSRVREVTAHPYGVLVKDPDSGKVVNEILIPRNASIPHEVRRTYFTIVADQTLVEARVTQGESPEPGEVRTVAATELPLPEGRPERQPIDVTFRYDEEGRMHCDFVDRTTGRQAALDYKEGTGLMAESEVAEAREEFRHLQIS